MIDVPLSFIQFITNPSFDLWNNYISTWKSELLNNPAHVFIETVLILFVLYILVVQRSYNPRIPNEVN